jgi:hypothetical protein
MAGVLFLSIDVQQPGGCCPDALPVVPAGGCDWLASPSEVRRDSVMMLGCGPSKLEVLAGSQRESPAAPVVLPLGLRLPADPGAILVPPGPVRSVLMLDPAGPGAIGVPPRVPVFGTGPDGPGAVGPVVVAVPPVAPPGEAPADPEPPLCAAASATLPARSNSANGPEVT